MNDHLRRLMRRANGTAFGLGAGAALVLAAMRQADAAVALGIGVLCGLANVLALMRGSERLLDSRNALMFGLSSLLRLAAFSIVAAALALRGPWWSLGPFLAGFFLPLATCAVSALRLFRTRA